MRQLSFTDGGFPLTNDRLVTMQNAWQEFKPLLALMGDNVKFQYGNNYYGIVAGEIYQLVGDNVETATRYTMDVPQVSKVTYENGTEQIFETVMTLRPSVTGSINLTPVDSSLASAINALQHLTNTVGGHTQDISDIYDILGVGGASVGDKSNTVKRGTIIMWGGEIAWKQNTLDGVMASGIPYGYVPCGDIVYNDSASIQETCAAWNAYLAALGASKRLSPTTSMKNKALNFSDVAGIDLSGRFVFATNTAPGIPSGNENATGKVTIQANNMPSHSHYVNDFYLIDNSSIMIGHSSQTTLPSKKISTVTGQDISKETDTLRAAYYTHQTGVTGGDIPIDVKAALPAFGLYYLIKMI